MCVQLGGTTIRPTLAAFFVMGLLTCDGSPQPVTRGVAAPTQLVSSDVSVVGSADHLGSVRDMRVLADGTIWVLSSSEPYFTVFHPTDDSFEAWGEEGGGPEEFNLPSALVSSDTDNEVWVYDQARHSFVELSQSRTEWVEGFLDSEAVPPGRIVQRSFFTQRARLEWGEGSVLLARSANTDQSPVALWDADLVAVDLRSGAVEDVLRLGVLLDAPADQTRAAVRFHPYPLWAACGERRIVLYDPTSNQLRSFDLNGVESQSLPLPPPRLTRIDVDDLVDAMLDDQMAALRASGEDAGISRDMLRDALSDRLDGVSGVYPEYVEMHCAPNGTVWIQPFDLQSGHFAVGPAWLRVEPSGNWEEVRMPSRFEPFRFTTGRIWGVLLDENDVPSVAWLGLDS